MSHRRRRETDLRKTRIKQVAEVLPQDVVWSQGKPKVVVDVEPTISGYAVLYHDMQSEDFPWDAHVKELTDSTYIFDMIHLIRDN